MQKKTCAKLSPRDQVREDRPGDTGSCIATSSNMMKHGRIPSSFVFRRWGPTTVVAGSSPEIGFDMRSRTPYHGCRTYILGSHRIKVFGNGMKGLDPG